MRCVTGPIDAATILLRALLLANDPDGRLDWRRLYVLPPGAPYRIDQRGNVYAVPWRKRTHRAAVERCILDMRKVFDGKTSRKLGFARLEATRFKRNPDGYEILPAVVHRMTLPAPHWWAAKFVDGRHVSEADVWVVPTLDALVTAASALLLRPEARGYFGHCQHCGLYFRRPTGWNKEACSEDCHYERRRQLTGARVKKCRDKARKARNAARNKK